MKSVLIAISACLVLASAVSAQAQDSATSTSLELGSGISSGEMTATPEMWFYQQYKSDYMDPKVAVREKAEFRASQRQRRIAARKWFGFSNIRPTVSPDPFNGDWSPRWTSNNPWYPSRWQGTGQPWTVLYSNQFVPRTY